MTTPSPVSLPPHRYLDGHPGETQLELVERRGRESAERERASDARADALAEARRAAGIPDAPSPWIGDDSRYFRENVLAVPRG